MSIRQLFISIVLTVSTLARADDNWPQFRGPGASGLSPTAAPTEFDVPASKNIRWKITVPGLGHSSPVIWGNRVFLTTAVPVAGGEQPLKAGLYGDIGSVEENAEYRWLVLCYEKSTGKKIWEREAHRGVPKIKRHPKSSHANSTPATDGERLVAFFGSEGLFCYDLDGQPLWQKNFGLLDSGFFVARGAQWGFASSPVLFDDKVIILADVQDDSFITALDAKSGEQLWRTPRTDVPTWGTPTVYRSSDKRATQILVNGFREIAGYDFADGTKIWTMTGGGDIPVPTPIVAPAHNLAFITSAHGLQSPIYAIKLDRAGSGARAGGDISLPQGENASDAIAWSIRKGGNYMQTPILLGDLLFACRDNGVLTCFDAKTGKQHYRHRLDGTGFTASPVAAGQHLYFTGEDGRVHVIKAAATFESLAENDLGEACLATPAISGGTIFFRTQRHLIVVGD